jgi:hypothetical protein
MALSILLASVNVKLIYKTSLGGSLIFGPMIKFHAVGQDYYTNFCITVYIYVAIFAETSSEFGATD